MPRRFSNSELLAWTLVGAAFGVAAGFAARQWLGPVDRERAGQRLRALVGGADPGPQPVSGSMALQAVRVALARDPELIALDLTVVVPGRGVVELHGWVPNRRIRARAARLAAAAPGIESLLNCLLVRGEDDADLPALEPNDQTT
ncbi:MAG: BON domain-containing protein [Gemmatimonadales bacterium]